MTLVVKVIQEIGEGQAVEDLWAKAPACRSCLEMLSDMDICHGYLGWIWPEAEEATERQKRI